MSEYSVSLDWLRYSAPQSYPHALIVPELIGTGNNELSPLPHYTNAVELEPAGRLDWNTVNDKQGSLVTFGGHDLQVIRDAGIEPNYLVRYIHERKWTRASRIDIAIDIFDEIAHPLDLLDAWNRGDIKTHAKKIEAIEGWKKDKQTGETVYIGSRTSDTYFRCYDKGKEQGVPRDWTRLELELKGLMAKQAQKKIPSSGLAAVAKSKLTAFVEVNNVPWWGRMLMQLPEATDIMRGKRKQEEGKREKWLHTQALKAVCDAIEEGDSVCRDGVLMSLIKYGNNNSSTLPDSEK